jgi:hypothetical protein
MSYRSRCIVGCLLAAWFVACGAPVLRAQVGVGSGAPAKSYAFLVACSEYDKRELNKLEFTLRDVQEFYDVLVAAGFPKENIVLMHDNQPRDLLPEGRKIREQLDLLLARVDRNATLIVALSGHGVQFEGKKGNFFCPLDARLAEPETLISLDEVYQQLDACNAHRKLLLVDACRNNPQSNLARSRAVVKLDMAKPQLENVPNGIVAMFSCSSGQQSYEHPELKHGVFFYHMIQAWKGAADSNRDAKLTLDELLNYTKVKTETFAHLELKAKQIPNVKGDFTGTWLLRDLPAVSQTPDGLWQITSAAAFDGQPYTGHVRIRRGNNGLFHLAWLGSQGQTVQSGIGYFENGHLFAAWGVDQSFGINFYKIRADRTLLARWTHIALADRMGAEWSSPGAQGRLEGEYGVRGTSLTAPVSEYTGSLAIARHGDVYDFDWRNDDGKTYRGIGIRHEDNVVVGWTIDGGQAYGVVDYLIEGNTARGRWTMNGQRALSHENLVRINP